MHFVILGILWSMWLGRKKKPSPFQPKDEAGGHLAIWMQKAFTRNTNLLAPATPLAPLLFTAASRTTHVPTTAVMCTLVHRSARSAQPKLFSEIFFQVFS
jgi:hypothetical protein